MFKFTILMAGLAIVMFLGVTGAYAQATRTWVSGVGDDANPCSRTAPCKTFAGAISKTAARGEINALDPGGFGAVTITKAIILDGGGSLAGVLAASGTNGINVNAGATDTVILRNLDINGAGSGANGVRFVAGGALHIEKTKIYGFTQNGIDVSLTGSGTLEVNDSSITGGATGISINSTSGTFKGLVDHVVITGATGSGAGNGIDANYGVTTVRNSVISQNSGFGVVAENGATLSVVDSLLTQNFVAVQAGTSSTVRLSNNDIYDNGAGLGCGGGTIASTGDNRKAGNVGAGVPVCTPNATITVQ
jgi:hypothetical protein